MKAIFYRTLEEAVSMLREDAGGKGRVLFASAADVQALAEWASPETVLCSTKGEYTMEGFRSGVVAGFEYEAGLAETVEILDPPVLSASRLDEAYGKVKDNENAFLLLLCDGRGGMEETILSSLYFIGPAFKIVGGSAADDDSGQTYLYIGSRRVRNLGIFFQAVSRTALLKENIYKPSGTRLLVTDADLLERRVRTFNGRPAAEAYAEALGISQGELSGYFLSHPLGKKYENDWIIASPMAVHNDGSLSFYSQLMPSTYVDVLKAEDPLQVLDDTLGSSPFVPGFVLNINCTLRERLFSRDGLWKAFDDKMISFCGNTAGFISYGEQYYRKHANQTMILLLVE